MFLWSCVYVRLARVFVSVFVFVSLYLSQYINSSVSVLLFYLCLRVITCVR